MGSKLILAGAALATVLAVPASAATIGFVSNPANNSGDFATTVAGMGGTIASIDFDTHPLGAFNTGFYSVSDGVTFAGTFGSVDNGTVANAGGLQPPLNPGEGPHDQSNFVRLPTLNQSVSISFDSAMLGVGIYALDLFNPSTQSFRNPLSISAYSGTGGTGTLLGTFESPQFNFQLNNQVFLGIVSTDQDIRSITINNFPVASGDAVALDDLQFASAVVPEPGSVALFGLGALGLGFVVRRRRRKAVIETA